VTSKIFGAVLLIAGGSLAMLGAIRRASSRVRSLAAARPLLEIDVGERLPLASRTMKKHRRSSFGSGASTNQGTDAQ
jgi:hypothetical protein